MLFNAVVQTSQEVAATRARKIKITNLAALLATATKAVDVAIATGYLIGVPRQGKTGTGWRSLANLATSAAEHPSLTVQDVDQILTALTNTTGSGSRQERQALLTNLFSKATETEQKFLFRLLTGELRQGALDGIMVDAVASAFHVPVDAVRRAYFLRGDLAAVAVTAFTGGKSALLATGLLVGQPLRPMLASPAKSLSEAINELGDVHIEYKMDGARIQVHRIGNQVWVFTRTLRDITASVPELVAVALQFPCHSVVLDGETLALHDDGRPRSFQETMSRFGATLTRELLLQPYFFDILHLDGTDLIDLPLRERLSALHKIVGKHSIPATTDLSLAESTYTNALDQGHEGVMVKALDSSYAAGRRGKAWQKVKPVHTLDLILLGAEWGYGRRTGFLSNLHLAARDPDGGPPIMVGKTFKGLTDEILAWQTTELPTLETHRDDYTVYIRPELVVEIALDGVQISPRYPGGVALRFARLVRYRPDKTASDADTITTVRNLLPATVPPTTP